ncbi:MAG: sulfite exporter TauE/SafE family protein [Patescibacteria group bacterium]
MTDYLIQPFLLGISVGIFCFTYCVPFIGPYLVSEQRKIAKNFKIILEFILGRLGGYILFGAIFGYLGERISNQTVNLILITSLMVLSVVLIFYAIGFLKPKGIFCSAKYIKFREKSPILMGFLMGINICPPFLMSLAYVFSLHSILKGIIYFLMFFMGTTLYFLPITFLGFLGLMKEFRLIARIAGLIVGFAFLIYGVYYIIRGLTLFHAV